ncbi:MAG: T9SS C-terminal target domain-containing protein, partial [Bacteroidia bacterium]
PAVPAEIAGPDFDNQVTIFAKFAEQHTGYVVNLKTKLNDTGEYFPTPPVHKILDVNGDGTSGTYLHNENVLVAAEPEWGYSFQHWKYLNGSWIIQNQTFIHKVTEPATLVAVFTAAEYQLHVEATEGGTAEGGGLFTRLSEEIGEPFVSAGADPDYEFVNWTDEQGNIISSEEEFQYFVTENVFESGPYEITLTANFILKSRDLLFNIHGIHNDDAVITLDDMINDPGNYLFENVPFGTHNYTVEVPGFNNYYGVVLVNETTEDQIVVEFVQCPPPAVEVFVISTQLAVQADAEEWELRLYELSDVNGEEVTQLVYGPVLLEGVYEYLVEDINPDNTYLPAIRAICHEPGFSVFSKSVPNPSAINTVKPGDVDGDGLITAIDVNLISAYINNMLGNRPVIMNALELIGLQGPVFIFDAADINPMPNGQIGDGIVDILDVVAWTNIWLNQFYNNNKGILTKHADIFISSNIASLESDGMVSGIQFEMHGKNLEYISLHSLLPGYSLSWNIKDNLLSGVLFSLEGNPIPKGMVDIMEIVNGQNLEWGQVQAANIYAQPVLVYTYDTETSVDETADFVSEINVYPNPSQGRFRTDIHIPGPADLNLVLYDLGGRQISSKQIAVNGGYESVSWNETIKPGLYILRAFVKPYDLSNKPHTKEIRVVITH